MSAELEFRVVALAHAPLTALVAGRVALNAAPQGSVLPIVAYTVSHEKVRALTGALAEDIATVDAECWAATSVQAEAVADALEAALDAQVPYAKGIATQRTTGYDPEHDLHAVRVSVQWMD